MYWALGRLGYGFWPDYIVFFKYEARLEGSFSPTIYFLLQTLI